MYLQDNFLRILRDDFPFDSDDKASEEDSTDGQAEKRAPLRDTYVKRVCSNPFLSKAVGPPHLLLDLVEFAADSRKESRYALRECLILLEDRWKAILDVPCPYSFTSEELDKHRKEADDCLAIMKDKWDFE